MKTCKWFHSHHARVTCVQLCKHSSDRILEWLLAFPTLDNPTSMLSSCRWFAYSLNIESILIAQPCHAQDMTWDNTGSDLVACLNLSVSMGRNSIWLRLNTDIADTHWLCSLTFNGSREKPSAFECSLVGQHLISYWYAASRRAHLCSPVVASVGNPLFGPRIVSSGLWSVTKLNHLSYRNWWNFRIPNTRESASFSNCA